ncbi:hypothetical protein M378DRAFT_160444 [Amanita muscaria Koide BX008]|uniref:Uncharacterized protein n=1 Tax=Amanita muscaria (strain Koide BX008) TaxID=946122 RepID=A0A0C2SU29_AMAMK|nr:hypothetical protein M378DRAFT_160444 [Amanita muscaria Koide BX008]
MSPFNAILECLCMGRSANYGLSEEQPALGFPHEKKQTTESLTEDSLSTESLAEDILSTLYTADTNDEHLAQRIQDLIHETEWYEDLAIVILNGLENALKASAPMGQAMKDAYEKAAQVVADIWGFAKEHPVFCALVALGILVILLPWAIEVLGFGELGPTEGSFAAWWQSTYGGSVPAGSLFSFFQRLGMVWRWDPKYHGPMVR